MNEGSTGGDASNPAWVSTWHQTETLDALRDLLDTSRRATPALARRLGLSHTEVAVMEHIFAEALGPSELAQRVGVTAAAISGIVDRLQARGHVAREPHPTDRRRTAVVATASGREEMLSYLMPMFLGLAEADAALTDEERAVVLRYLLAARRAVARLL